MRDLFDIGDALYYWLAFANAIQVFGIFLWFILWVRSPRQHPTFHELRFMFVPFLVVHLLLSFTVNIFLGVASIAAVIVIAASYVSVCRSTTGVRTGPGSRSRAD